MDQGSFAPLVFTVAGGLEGEGRLFTRGWQRFSVWIMELKNLKWHHRYNLRWILHYSEVRCCV